MVIINNTDSLMSEKTLKFKILIWSTWTKTLHWYFHTLNNPGLLPFTMLWTIMVIEMKYAICVHT